MTLLATAAQYRAQLMAHEATTTRTLEAVHAQMVQSLAPHLGTLYDAIAAQQGTGKLSPTFLYQGKRLAHVTQAVDHAVGQYATFATATITQSQQVASHLATQSTSAQLGYVLSPTQHMTANTPDVTEHLIKAMGTTASLVASYAHDAAIAVKVAVLVGVSLGSTIKAIDKQVTRALDASRWRSVTVAATAPVQVYRATTLTILDANDIPAWMWVSDKTASVCDICFAMDGTQHPIYEDMESHPNCFPAGTVVSGPRVVGSTTRWYEGEIVDIETANGNLLTVTPNHPILTSHGWVAAGNLNEGSNIVSHGGSHSGHPATVTNPDDYQVEAPIEQVAATFGEPGNMTPVSMPTASEDFHGDGIGSQVHVVRADRHLWNSHDTVTHQPLLQKQFCWRRSQLLALACVCPSRFLFERLWTATGSIMSGMSILATLFRGHLGGSERLSGACASMLNASTAQSLGDDVTRYAIGLCKSKLRFPREIALRDVFNGQGNTCNASLNTLQGVSLGGRPEQSALLQFHNQASISDMETLASIFSTLTSDICLDSVVKIHRRSFSGHVYNLQTVGHWYIANNIITHNCHCIPIPLNDLQASNNIDNAQKG